MMQRLESERNFTTSSFNKFLYYHSIQKPVSVGYKVIRPKGAKFQLIHMHHTLQFIPRICTHEIHINLQWGNFSYFHVLIISATKRKSYVFQAYPNLTNFLSSWFLYNKEKGIPLMGPKHPPPNYWRPGRMSSMLQQMLLNYCY